MIKYGQDAVRLALRVARRAKHANPAGPRRIAATIWRDQRGVTSLEFAFAALPLFGMIFSTMSLGIYYFYESAIDLGVYLSAREIMNGTAQASAATLLDSPADFTTKVLCPNMPSFVACSATNPTVAITVVADPTTLTQQKTKTNNGTNYTVTTLIKQPSAACTPQQGDIVYIQITYSVPVLNVVYSVFGGGQILSGTTVRVEEFPTGSNQFTC